MNSFIFENAIKVYFGEGCVKEYLKCLADKQGKQEVNAMVEQSLPMKN